MTHVQSYDPIEMQHVESYEENLKRSNGKHASSDWNYEKNEPVYDKNAPTSAPMNKELRKV